MNLLMVPIQKYKSVSHILGTNIKPRKILLSFDMRYENGA